MIFRVLHEIADLLGQDGKGALGVLVAGWGEEVASGSD